MKISEFKGIQQYHDGLTVSDYCNMIPLGNSIIDREGEHRDTRKFDEKTKVHETFIDSLCNIYIACSAGLFRYNVDNPGQFATMELPGSSSISPDISFCESSTKPSQVYCANRDKVYFWNTEDITVDEKTKQDYPDRISAFKPVRLPTFTTRDAVKNDGWLTDLNNDDKTGSYNAWWPDVNSQNYDLTKFFNVSRVTWFDNRLVLVDNSKNTVYLSAIDPSRYILPSDNGKNSPISIMSPIEATPDNNDYTFDFIPNYYSSTTSSARLVDAIAFAGSLYFLNDTSIEIWSATGNDLNPIQHNAQNTLYYGGRSPLIVADTLYLICRDRIHNDFIIGINQNGQPQRLSTIEIERQLQPSAYKLRALSVRDQTMMVCYKDKEFVNGYSITINGFWWRYYNGNEKNEYIAWTLLNRNGYIYGITNHANIARIDPKNRYLANEKPITRYVRGAFGQFLGRKILRVVNLICDTGIYLTTTPPDRPKLYLRVSFDRGLKFGPTLYRVLGLAGTNDREIMWRNCGSGNSILLEFGTADNVRFQIYGLDFELT